MNIDKFIDIQLRWLKLLKCSKQSPWYSNSKSLGSETLKRMDAKAKGAPILLGERKENANLNEK